MEQLYKTDHLTSKALAPNRAKLKLSVPGIAKFCVTLPVVAILFSACGNNNVEGFNPETEEMIAITTRCSIPSDITNYTELQSGDRVVKESEDTIVRLYHSENNLKSVCVESGQAHIERAL